MRFVNNLKTAMLLSFLMGLCMLIGYYFGGATGMFIGLLFGGAGNIIAYFYSDKITIAAMKGEEVAPQDAPWLHDMVERLAQRAGMPKPRIYICPEKAPNACATGRSPKHAAVVLTEGMLQYSPRDEIEGVLAHELAHVRNRDVLISTVAAVMAGMISYAAVMMFWFGGGQRSRDNQFGAIGAILMMILGPLAAGLIQVAISRQREFAADSYGGELAGDPRKLARALQRLQDLNEQIPMKANPAFHQMFIMEPLAGHSLANLFSTHPPTEARIAALVKQAQGR